jgi:hypothetical protein
MAGPLQRLSHTGAAVPSALASSLSVSGMSFVLTQIAGWPTGAGSQPFWVVVEPGTASEEKILCSSQSAGNINVAPSGRGGDGTVAIAHQAGVAVEHIFSALEADDANAHIYDASRDDHARYAPLDGSRPFTGLVTFNAGITDTGPLTQNGPVTITGNESVSGSLGVGGLATLSAGLSVTGNATVTGLETAGAVAVTGLPGAVTASRYVGGTAGAAPTSGTFAVGDFVVGANGTVWICTTAGSPGTWTPAIGTVGRPAGRIFPTTSTLVSAGGTQVVNMSADFTQGGMTLAANNLVVPVGGVYLVTANITYNAPGGGTVTNGFYNTIIYRQGVAARNFDGYVYTSGLVTPGFGGSDLITCAAGNTLSLYGATNASEYAELGAGNTWLSAVLVAS